MANNDSKNALRMFLATQAYYLLTSLLNKNLDALNL